MRSIIHFIVLTMQTIGKFLLHIWHLSQNFQNLDDKCKLIWILDNEDPTILRYLCQYLLSTTIWLNGIGAQQSKCRHVAPLGTHYSDSQPTNICSYSLNQQYTADVTLYEPCFHPGAVLWIYLLFLVCK